MIITIGGLAGTGTTTTAELLSEKLDIPYKYFAKKPLKTGFLKVKKELRNKEN